MKKSYETPTVEKIAFRYRDQVVAASGGNLDENGNGSGDMTTWGWNNESVWGSSCKFVALENFSAALCNIL